MMKTLAALLCLVPLAAFAASPEEDYIAARDTYIAQFKLKEGEQVTDAIAKAEVAARADLEKKMQALIGASGIKGVPEPGKLNLESLILGDMGFGMLEGLKYDMKGGTELLVTTRSLVERWLKAEQEIWKDRPGYAFGTEIGPALRTANFYTQAMANGAAVVRYADVPAPDGAVAMLIAHQQDTGPVVPKELIVAVQRGERLFIWNAPVTAKTTMIAPCKAIWDAAMRKKKEAYGKNAAGADTPAKIEDAGDEAMRACYNERAKAQPFFPALVKQAQELVARVK